ncbi:MAG: hypothetical protein HOQ24_14240, partial [Mycobacteriaceae bacterium]|nr:hypothetical protein [Mycobacteriaceae bacterium]
VEVHRRHNRYGRHHRHNDRYCWDRWDQRCDRNWDRNWDRRNGPGWNQPGIPNPGPRPFGSS